MSYYTAALLFEFHKNMELSPDFALQAVADSEYRLVAPVRSLFVRLGMLHRSGSRLCLLAERLAYLLEGFHVLRQDEGILDHVVYNSLHDMPPQSDQALEHRKGNFGCRCYVSHEAGDCPACEVANTLDNLTDESRSPRRPKAPDTTLGALHAVRRRLYGNASAAGPPDNANAANDPRADAPNFEDRADDFEDPDQAAPPSPTSKAYRSADLPGCWISVSGCGCPTFLEEDGGAYRVRQLGSGSSHTDLGKMRLWKHKTTTTICSRVPGDL